MKILHGSSNLALYWRFSVKMLQNGIISAHFDIYPYRSAGNCCIFAAFLLSYTRFKEITALLQLWCRQMSRMEEDNVTLVEQMNGGDGVNVALVDQMNRVVEVNAALVEQMNGGEEVNVAFGGADEQSRGS